MWAAEDKLVFQGAVEVLPQVQQNQPASLIGTWTVSGRSVIVTANTEIDQDRGPVAVGSCVMVMGTENPDKSVAASEIRTKSSQGGCVSAPPQDEDGVEFRGLIQNSVQQASNTNLTVGGRTVQVSPTTVVLPHGAQLAVGTCIAVQGSLNGDVVAASRIQQLGAGACHAGPGSGDGPRLVGLVETIPNGQLGDWKVAGQTVRVTADTRLETERGAAQVGSCVEVRGQWQAGVILASWLEVEDLSECQKHSPGSFEMTGIVETKPASGNVGDWVISGRTVRAGASTVFDAAAGTLIVGACVEVEGTLQADGVLVATLIKVESQSGMCILKHGVRGGASFSDFAISPGQIVSVFGINIGPATEKPLMVAPNDRVADKLSNTRVLFNGVPSPMLYASQGQINAVVPCGVVPGTDAMVQVESNGAWSNTRSVAVVAAWPAIFTLSNSGKGRGAILNVGDAGARTVNTPSNPIARGGMVEIYATGLGQTTPACVDGAITPQNGPYPTPTAAVTVAIDGENAPVTFVGSAPGFVYGLFQLNAQVPADAATGPNVEIKVKAGTATSPDGVTLAIR
ncbi:MAG: DUF5666 domain-containing protein [Acidobacteriales bacterium]|nr:DUF5666 domain-containing protein [Terriglobales bacterium]